MTPTEAQATVTLCLMAAFADGSRSDEERGQIRAIMAGMGQTDSAALVQDVLLRRVDLSRTVATLATPQARTVAYEMAVCVCDADGQVNDAERTFLADLAQALGIGGAQATVIQREADALAESPLEDAQVPARHPAEPGSLNPAARAGLPATATVATGGTPAAVVAAPAAEAQADQMVLKYAILNGALELLPQSLATMAIIPMQVKMVYRVGKLYGYSLDRGHIKEFIAALGVGATSQVLEGYARKLLGGFLRKSAGKWGRGMLGTAAGAATGAAFSFASTYALGLVAKRYYASGRRLSMADLKSEFAGLVESGKRLFPQHQAAVEQQARSIRPEDLAGLLRGG